MSTRGSLWECNICQKVSFFGDSIHFGCDQKAHQKFEQQSISATNLKCLICKRVSFTDKWNTVHDGCTHFRSAGPDHGSIASFHKICLDSIGASLDDLPEFSK